MSIQLDIDLSEAVEEKLEKMRIASTRRKQLRLLTNLNVGSGHLMVQTNL
jgi:hypothetical protein